MIDNAPISETTVAPESSAPVTDTSTTSPAPTPTTARPSRGRNGPRKSPAPSSVDSITDTLSKTYDAAVARDGGQQSAPSETPTEPAPEPIEAPNSYSKLLDVWGNVPREVQQMIFEREKEAQDKISAQGSEIAELRKAGGSAAELGGVIERYSAHIPRDQSGQAMAAPAVLEHLLAAHQMLEQSPGPAIMALANSYGVSLADLAFDPQAHAASEQQRQYQLAQHQYEVKQLHNQIAQLQHQQQQYHQQRMGYLHQETAKFFEGKEYSSELENEIHHQVAALRDRNPSLFEVAPLEVLKLAEERALQFTGISDKRKTTEAKKKADEARRLASLNVRSAVGRPP